MVLLGQLATTSDGRSDADAMRMARGNRTRSIDDAAHRRAVLTRSVELDVIPRLLLASRRVPVLVQQPALQAVTAAQVAYLVGVTLAADEQGTSGFVSALQDQGVSPEALYLDLLSPVARRLGEMWTEDECDFTEVTIGLWRLQNAMRELGPAFLGSAFLAMSDRQAGPRALLVPLPGEQHTFGLSMVFDFFRRAGWNAWSGPIADRAELATMVSCEWIDVVGFSLACDERLETARAEIQAVRLASRNPGLAVMVGGPPFVMDPSLAAAIGADGTALDGLQAVAEADALMKRDVERR